LVDTKNWLQDHRELELNPDNKLLLDKASDDDIIFFFHNTDVNICNGYNLENIVQERRIENQWSPNFKSKKLLDETRRRRSPIKSRSKIITNFMKLDYPKYFYEVDSKYRLKRTIMDKVDKGDRLPEISVPRFEAEQPVIRSFESDLSIYNEVTKGEIQKRETRVLDHRRKISLLRVSLNRMLWCKGFRRHKHDYFIPYEKLKPKGNEDDTPPIILKTPTREKEVVKVMYKNGELNFVQHHAINIRIEKFGDELGLLLWPIFFFTSDGINQVDHDWNKKLHEKYRNPLYNYNPNKRSEIKFWEDFLINGEFIREEDSWFPNFKLNQLKIIEVGWTPETIDKNQTLLDEWFEVKE